jgi:hypothetical protein
LGDYRMSRLRRFKRVGLIALMVLWAAVLTTWVFLRRAEELRRAQDFAQASEEIARARSEALRRLREAEEALLQGSANDAGASTRHEKARNAEKREEKVPPR